MCLEGGFNAGIGGGAALGGYSGASFGSAGLGSIGSGLGIYFSVKLEHYYFVLELNEGVRK